MNPDARRRRLFDQFYKSHYEISYRYLRARRFPDNHTRDLLQHCFELAWKRFDEYLEAGRPRYWFLGILKNRLRYVASRMARDPGAEATEVERQADSRRGPEAETLRLEEQSYFFKAICELPPHYADVVKLRLEGYDYRTIAELLEISIKAAEHRMSRALVKLERPMRKFLEDMLEGEG